MKTNASRLSAVVASSRAADLPVQLVVGSGGGSSPHRLDLGGVLRTQLAAGRHLFESP